MVNAPMKFPGTDEEIRANRDSHNFVNDEDMRCFECDCRPGGRVVEWPCGTHVPRVNIIDGIEVPA